jgi:membrane protein implicated in regulation of membrane protease activity
MESFIASLPFDLRYLWLMIGAGLILLEVLGASGIGLLFGGLAALIVAVLIEAGTIGESNLILQGALWFAITATCAVLLFRPLKKWRTNPHAKDTFENIIGTHATVASGGLMIGKPGKVMWSGTLMNAQVTPECGIGAFLEGDTVTVCAVKGNQLIVCATDSSSAKELSI